MKNYAYILVFMIVFEMFAMENDNAFALQKYGTHMVKEFAEKQLFIGSLGDNVTSGERYVHLLELFEKSNHENAKKDFLSRWEKIEKIKATIPSVEQYQQQQKKAEIFWASLVVVTEVDLVRQLYMYKKEEISSTRFYAELLFALVAIGKGIQCRYNIFCAQKKVEKWRSCYRSNFNAFESVGKKLFPQDFAAKSKVRHDD